MSMRTTINLDDALLAEAKQVAARTGRSLTAVVEDALRQSPHRRHPTTRRATELPVFGEGGTRPGRGPGRQRGAARRHGGERPDRRRCGSLTSTSSSPRTASTPRDIRTTPGGSVTCSPNSATGASSPACVGRRASRGTWCPTPTWPRWRSSRAASGSPPTATSAGSPGCDGVIRSRNRPAGRLASPSGSGGCALSGPSAVLPPWDVNECPSQRREPMTEPPANPTPRPGLGRPPAGRPRGPSNVSILTGPAGVDRRMSWAKALRRVRGWLTSSVLLQRCWRGWSTSPPPRVTAGADWVTAGRSIHQYLPR
jgi:hypothetical protein